MKKLLLIDDDEGLAEPLREYFSRFELQLDNETDPLRGIEKLRRGGYELLVLDIMLPGIDGFETCRRIRQFSDLPIVMLTARGEVMDRVVGLELGADDYLPKPFEPRELVARIQNILRRSRAPVAGAYRFGDFELDTAGKRLCRGDAEIDLTAAEYELLQLLLRNRDRVLSRDDIMQALHGIEADIYSRAVDVLISRLRQKLQRPELIRTVRGKGYQLVDR
jgi:OmpR family response regulator RpaB